MREQERSITWVVGALMLLIAGFGWGFLAGSYEGAMDSQNAIHKELEIDQGRVRIPRRPGIIAVIVGASYRFVRTSFNQLSNLPTVISWHFSNRVWLPILIVSFEGLALAAGCGLKYLETQLSKPHKRKRKFPRPQ